MVKLMMGNGRFDFDIVGESHHQHAISLVVGPKIPNGHDLDCLVALVQDDANAYDPMAVSANLVFANGNVLLMGHLSRKDARIFRKSVSDTGGPDPQGMLCRARIVGGWREVDGSEGHFGLKLDLVLPFRKFGTIAAWKNWKQRLLEFKVWQAES